LCTITGRVTGRNLVLPPAEFDAEPVPELPGVDADGAGALEGVTDGEAELVMPDTDGPAAAEDDEPVTPLDGATGVDVDSPTDPAEEAAAVESTRLFADGAIAALPDVVEVHPASNKAAATRVAECFVVNRWGAARRIGDPLRMILWMVGDAAAPAGMATALSTSQKSSVGHPSGLVF